MATLITRSFDVGMCHHNTRHDRRVQPSVVMTQNDVLRSVVYAYRSNTENTYASQEKW